MAPHIFVEDISIRGIEKARSAYLHGDLKKRLARYHDNPDLVFWRWNRVWLNPKFRDWNIEPLLSSIRCPVLAIQGVDDEYGTIAQIDGIKRHVPQAVSLMIPNCRHAPQKDQPEIVIEAITDFMTRLSG